jgi:hypothetical protein
MTEPTRPKIENLELNKETVADLSEEQAAETKGGAVVVRQQMTQTSPAVCIVPTTDG